jgi:hypothetical protein
VARATVLVVDMHNPHAAIQKEEDAGLKGALPYEMCTG